MFTNAGLVIRLVVAAVFVCAGVLLLRRSRDNRLGAWLITAGGLLFLAGEVYGMVVLRPFVGRYFDEQWHLQVDVVDALSTLGLLVCAGGLVVHALRKKSSRSSA